MFNICLSNWFPFLDMLIKAVACLSKLDHGSMSPLSLILDELNLMLPLFMQQFLFHATNYFLTVQ